MSAAPVFFVGPRVVGVNSSGAANSVKTLAGANNTVAVATGGAAGSIIQRVFVVQNGTGASTANNICRFYLYDGTSYYLVHEVNLGGAVTPSATVIGIRITVPELVGIKLPSNTYVLHVGFSAAAAGDTFTISAEVVDL
jgi:uncharacterized protein (UPF0333 family)